MLSKQDAGINIGEWRREKGLRWSEHAERAACPNVWLVSAVLGMHPVPEEVAEFLRKELELDDELVKALRRQPTRVPEREIATDPTIYRFHELIDVYGPALKALIHDEFGDGIMSAINCSLVTAYTSPSTASTCRMTGYSRINSNQAAASNRR